MAMGGLLVLPLKIAYAVYAIFDRGSLSWLSYVISYIYLSVVERVRKRRFQKYDYLVDRQPEKTGFFIPPKEWIQDTPQKTVNFDESADDAFFFGVNSKCEGLVVHVSRQTDEKVSCSLLLRFSDDRQFILPEDHVLQSETLEEYAFGSSRLKLQCLLPMRKWRIFFNGILREHSIHSESAHPKYHHVSFTFIFTASSDVFDFQSDMSKTLLVRHASISSSTFSEAFPLHTLKRVRDVFNSYEQSGMILGTVKIEDEEEKEIYLWGNRGRYMGKTRNLGPGDFVQIYGNFQNGAVISIGILNVDGMLFKFSHGYVMRSDGFIHPIETLSRETAEVFKGQYSLVFFCGGVNYELTVIEPDFESKFQKEYVGTTIIKFSDLVLNGWTGRGFVFKGSIDGHKIQPVSRFVKPVSQGKEKPLIVSFGEMCCQDSELTGGKGSSLGKLYGLSLEFRGMTKVPASTSFQVSKGIVVTTEGYKLFIKGDLSDCLEKFQKEVWSEPEGGSKELCQKMVEKVAKSKIPDKVAQNLKDLIRKVFSTDYAKRKFAVRSSATGEDTEQMSAAGQMETFLGLRSTDEILDAVRKCWASQFTFQAVEYKRRYGQLLNTPMAVVVQEMVPCEVAGVAFTCDPLTGNPSYLSITANYGLGESVVSASAEPDTVVLKRDIDNNLEIHSVEIGEKKSKIVMAEGDSGVQTVNSDGEHSSVCCLSNELSLKLGRIALKLEEKFGSPRDLEWGIVGKEIYLFQARPITSLDRETDFETKHVFDTFMRLENEYFSKANIGEVMPGATSPLGLDFLSKCFDICYPRQKFVRWDGSALPEVPYFDKRLTYAYRHVFFCLMDAFMRFEESEKEFTKALMIAMYGREIGDEDLTHFATERHIVAGKTRENYIVYNLFCGWIRYTSGFFNRRVVSPKVERFKIATSLQSSPSEVVRQIADNIQICSEAMTSHMECSISSSMWNMKMLTSLSKAKGDWDHEVYSDFGYLLSTCSQLESADVPAAIQKLGLAIVQSIDPQKFKHMDETEALKWLQTTDTEAGKQFHHFIKRHGHRCLKEFDMMTAPWEANPKALIKMLQNFVSADTKAVAEKEVPSYSSIISNLHVSLSFMPRINIYWLLVNCRRAVREREYGKSVLIKSFNKLRKAFYCLAEVMAKEGYLPRKELLFFLCIEEIRQLLKSRSPRLVASAIKRSKCHEELDQLMFPEIASGVPKPINMKPSSDVITGGFIMTGVPISPGKVKATARVAMNLEEAATIQHGDVLITYSTDIGWSPYFPLLSGVVTEIGGLVSHGAVVAREYGLPCVVGLHGATQAFKSGDVVVLDGNKGTLQKIETDEHEKNGQI